MNEVDETCIDDFEITVSTTSSDSNAKAVKSGVAKSGEIVLREVLELFASEMKKQ